MTSIRHFPATHPLPDWRNFGVMLRVLLGVNGLALLAALVQAGDIGKWLGSYLQMAAVVEPLLLVGECRADQRVDPHDRIADRIFRMDPKVDETGRAHG